MNVTFFPENKLSAKIASIFNGHIAIVCHNTDRLIDRHYALAELYAFKYNVQCTSFLHAFGESTATTLNGETFFENTNYGETIKAVHNTGRISFGLYWRSDMWFNPKTNIQQAIPDYNATKWSATGAATFKNAVEGASKQARYPNHGQQMYDISGGDFGYDMNNHVMGISNLSETFLHTDQQLNHIKEISGLEITSGSYTNGAQGGWNVLIPKMFGMRNSVHSVNSDGNIKYFGLNRQELMTQGSTCRAWDAVNAGQFSDQLSALNYSASEIDRAINAGGLYSEFMHWHSLYRANDTAFFEPFMQMINNAINGRDVWRAGNNEVNEYYLLANSIDKIGSYIDKNKAFIFIRFKDLFIASNTNGISNAIDPTKISTPISIELDLSGTSLAGKIIKSTQAQTVRDLGSNKWIVNVSPIDTFKNGYMIFVIEESSNNEQIYDSSLPILSKSGNTIYSDKKSKFLLWRKAKNADKSSTECIYRSSDFYTSLSYPFDLTNYTYEVGAITKSRVSSALTIN
ncbi:hypothetical protein GWP85_16735 [Acinetobacter beijerinckii]|uniref:hypothetical protein n=1 Tax=Acinetobacter beijerinckii TaxID=262668 RepID=UPI0023DD6891|nr:hypothetical protein [Acinetobacter beijerinckii]MDF2419138.1 hypothetical protein [Acinetobacter beijerinckii]